MNVVQVPCKMYILLLTHAITFLLSFLPLCLSPEAETKSPFGVKVNYFSHKTINLVQLAEGILQLPCVSCMPL